MVRTKAIKVRRRFMSSNQTVSVGQISESGNADNNPTKPEQKVFEHKSSSSFLNGKADSWFCQETLTKLSPIT